MSGFEVAGIVLGTIPLAISALEHYKAGKGLASSFLKWRGLLDTLIFRLKLQKTFFYLQILELLREARVAELDDRIDLTEEECAMILRNAKTAGEVREYLGGLYATFQDVLDRYEACLKTIVAKLGHIQRLPGTKRDNLEAVLAANVPKDGKYAFAERLAFTIERGSLKVLLEELREERLSLKEILKGLKTEQKYFTREPAHDARRLAANLTEVQEKASALFTAMCNSCTCACHRKHKVLIRLDNRVPQEDRRRAVRRIKEPTMFSLVFDIEDGLQEAGVRAAAESRGKDGMFPPMGGLNGPAVTVTPFSPSVTLSPACSSPSVATGRKSVSVTDLCRHVKEARTQRQTLALELVAESLELSYDPGSQQRDFASPVTLEQLLTEGCRDDDVRLTPKQQTMLALDVASSLLQLRQTCWSNMPWNNKQIMLLLEKAAEGEHEKTEVCGPFIRQTIHASVGTGAVAASPTPKGALLELAILLLEIWHHKPMEMWMTKLGTQNADTPEARHIAAIRWLEMTHERLPPHHLTAIEQCLAICSGRLWRWNDWDFQRQYCENIIKPLRESCKAW